MHDIRVRAEVVHDQMRIAAIRQDIRAEVHEFKRSLQFRTKLYELSKKINYTRGMHLALNNIGVVYMNSDLLNKALSYFLRSLKIVEDSKDYIRASNLYFNCGMIYKRTSDFARGLGGKIGWGVKRSNSPSLCIFDISHILSPSN